VSSHDHTQTRTGNDPDGAPGTASIETVSPSGHQPGTRLPSRTPGASGVPSGSDVAIDPSPTIAASERRNPLLRALSWFDPHNLVCWLYVAMLALGVVLTYTQLVRPGLHVSTPAVLFSIAFWALFALPWIVFIAHRELFARLSRRTAVLGFLWGGFIATFVIAMTAEIPFLDTLTKLFGPEFVASWGPGITAGWIEEIAAGLGIVAVLFVLRTRLRSPFEMMVLGMFVGLGFQVVEDFEYMIHGLNMTFGEDVFASVVHTAFARILVASWWSHQLFTGLFGAGLGYLMSRDTKRKPAVAVGLMLSAIVLHSFWDSPLLDMSLVGPLIKGFLMLAFFVWVYRMAASSERDWVVDVLTPEADAGRITTADIDSLAPSYHRRKKAWHHLHHQHGSHAVEAEKAYQASLIELADDLVDARADGTPDDSPGLAAVRAEVAERRADRDAALAPAGQGAAG
jgi:protease PrsW